ncbi:MAG: hypothetical protein P9M10_05540 [Candidatus Euphemobacter frigidus]|nr:hypothetical protein [Candidatus Euphemobacter frigidus]
MKLTEMVLSIGLALFFSNPGYTMQPPPAPLDSPGFQALTGKADIIVVGKVVQVTETEEAAKTGREITVEVTLKIGDLLKGDVSGENIHIQESYPGFDSIVKDLTSSKNKISRGQIVSTSAGPRPYHGKYKEGDRIIVLLKVIEGKDKYRPLGSGTYDEYFCEFLIQAGGIKTLYFKFADDIEKYTRSEDEFIGLIKKLSEKNL